MSKTITLEEAVEDLRNRVNNIELFLIDDPRAADQLIVDLTKKLRPLPSAEELEDKNK